MPGSLGHGFVVGLRPYGRYSALDIGIPYFQSRGRLLSLQSVTLCSVGGIDIMLLKIRSLFGHLNQNSSGSNPNPISRLQGRVKTKSDRLEVCRALSRGNHASVIWLYDLLFHYGGPTVVWDVHVLVDDLQAAANCLKRAGYLKIEAAAQFADLPEFNEKAIRMKRATNDTCATLMAASEWHYNPRTYSSSHYPPLAEYLNSLIATWLNISTKDYVDRLEYGLFIGNLINGCYDLEDGVRGAVKSEEYAQHLDPEHRELHYDIVAASTESFTTTRRHAYHMRKYREIKDGLYEARPYAPGKYRQTLSKVAEVT